MVQAVAAPVVVRLPCRHGVLDHQGGVAGVVADGERHVALRAVARDELQQVDALGPVVGDVDPERRRPVRLDHVGPGRPGGRRLIVPAQRARPPDEPTAEALVVADPIRLDVEGSCRCRDEHGHFVAHLCAHGVGVSLDARRGADRGSATSRCRASGSRRRPRMPVWTSRTRSIEWPGLPGTGSTHRWNERDCLSPSRGSPSRPSASCPGRRAGRDGEQQHHRDAARMPGTERVPRGLDPHRTHPFSPRWPA